MSKLEELEESLYGREDRAPAVRGRKQMPFPASGRMLNTSWSTEKSWPGVLSKIPVSKVTAMVVLAGALFIIGAGVFAFLYLGNERREARIEIGGRDTVEGGESVTIPVLFRNVSADALEDADFIITFPRGTLFQNESGRLEPVAGRVVRRIGTLAAGTERLEQFTAQFFGREGEEKTIGASLAYRPAGLKARFSSEAEKRVTITRVPLVISWDIPEIITPGQEVAIIVRYSSQARAAFDNLWLLLEYPPGFTVMEAVPAASGADDQRSPADARWPIGALAPGEEKKLSLKAIFGNVGGDIQSLRVGIGVLNETTKELTIWQESVREVRLFASPFLLEGSIGDKREGIIKPGDFLSLKVRYKNRSAVAVKNITIRTALRTEAIDFSTLSISDGGIFDFLTKDIVWGPGGTTALQEVAPGQEGALHMSARMRPRPVVATNADKNLTIVMSSRMETSSIPAELKGTVLSQEDRATFKVSTIALISGRSVFRTSPIANTGPVPPKVGEKTTYAIVWEVRNFTNEIEGAEMRASLPPNIRWEGVVSPQDADVRFDAASGEVRWRLGRVTPGTGVLVPAKVVAFQVSLIPSEVDVGRTPALTGDVRFSGRDTFTGEDLALEISGVSTQLPEDPLVKGEEWTVKQ